jgi:gamma-glutamyl hercynylcysteine S-oxide synthase
MAAITPKEMRPASGAQPATTSGDPQRTLAALDEARRRTLALVAPLADAELERAHSPIMSPLAWDLGHIAAYEDLWLAHRLGGMELLRGDLAERYDAFETPRSVRSEIAILGAAEARAYMRSVRARVAEALERSGVGDGVVCEMVIRHELQHTETMRQTLAIAGLLPAGEPALQPMDDPPGWVQIAAGGFHMGAAQEGFAYDNERPRHPVSLPAFAIARRPVSNESWMQFSHEGGYERREWWSPAGWAWKCQEDAGPHPAVAAGDPRAPACHVSWFEAEAFARARDARLPGEAEWEKAARASDGKRTPDGSSAGALAAVGQVWEWTRSSFCGYPGFRAYPYREYSEVFFGDSYRVLRGSSWATARRVASVTFRNWDLPQRRQIFAGVRLARDAAS